VCNNFEFLTVLLGQDMHPEVPSLVSDIFSTIGMLSASAFLHFDLHIQYEVTELLLMAMFNFNC